MKKIIAILAIILSVGMCVNAQDMSELKKYGIMQGDPNGDMRLEDGVKRSEMAKIIMTALDYGACAKTATPFSDVAAWHWASGYINEAYKAGIIAGRGNGIFAPEDGVSNEEAVKMVVCALGYGQMAEQTGGYPFGYMQTAERIGLLKNISVNGSAEATRATVAAIVSNALDIPVLTSAEAEDGSGDDFTLTTRTIRTMLEN